MREESRAQEEAARETVRRTLESDLAELAGYRTQIDALRESLRTLLESLDRQADSLAGQADDLTGSAPVGNLSLFR